MTPGTRSRSRVALHNELALLIEGGLTAAEALRRAALGPAELLRATNSLGAARRGTSPISYRSTPTRSPDIHHSAKVRLVVHDGRVLDRRALDALLLLGAARRQAKSNWPRGGGDNRRPAE